MTAAACPLVGTRISERERSPRELPVKKTRGYERAGQPVKTAGREAGSLRSVPSSGATRANGPGFGPKDILPRHVQACRHSPFRHERWFIWTWQRGRPFVKTRVPYSCRSWRCPVCRKHEAHVAFARIMQAVDRHRNGWCFLVLTLDRNGFYSGKPWSGTSEAYAELSRLSRNFLARLRRMFHGEPGHRWVAVVERHKRAGWPHMNLLVHSLQLARVLEASRIARVEAGATERESLLLEGDLLEAATATGWGVESTAEVARNNDAVAGYIVKVVGESAKITQAPTNAPLRFRRLRSGYDRKRRKPFLPPRHHGTATGVLVRRRRSEQGDWEILRINPPKDPASEQPIREAVVAEVQLIREEETALTEGREMPDLSVRLAIGERIESWQDSERRQTDEELAAVLSRWNASTGRKTGRHLRRAKGSHRSRSG